MRNNDLHRAYGIIGSSLNHSLSPIIHDYLFKKSILSCTYTSFEIKPVNLGDAIAGIRALGIKGVNITFPFKQKVIKYLDKLDSSACTTGAVNAIKNTQGVLTGYNTDLFGIRKTLADRLKFNPQRKNIIILGAGGVARACIQAMLSKKPTSLLIFNRKSQNASLLVDSFAERNKDFANNIKVMTDIRGRESNYRTNLIINATSAGKEYVKNKLSALSRRGMLENTIFFDLNYGDRALSNKLPEGIDKSEDGLYMLAAQASKSFQIWTGKAIPPYEIFDYLNRKIKRK